MSLTRSLRWDIQNLGQRLASAASSEELTRRGASKAEDRARNEQELKRIVQDIRKLLDRIEDAVPFINLAITASGASLSSSLPSTVSPSRLLQASTFLTAGDSQYSISRLSSVQIGPTFILSMYMLFLGHLRPQGEDDIRESTWKEVIHKAIVKLVRVSIDNLNKLPGEHQQTGHRHSINQSRLSTDETERKSQSYFPSLNEAENKAGEYAYQLVIVEDLDDGRLHTFEDGEAQPGSYDDIALAGIREAVPVHQISKIFYADTGKILNIGNEGETNSPVLLLKRDLNAIPPRRMMERYGDDDIQHYDIDNTKSYQPGTLTGQGESISHKDEFDDLGQDVTSSLAVSQSSQSQPVKSPDPWRIPPDLDPEWIAFEVYTESFSSDSESETEISSAKSPTSSRTPSIDPQITSALSRLNIASPSTKSTSSPSVPTSPTQPQPPVLPPIRTSLSLLETLLRLLSLQQFQQTPHLSIPDELLTFFLSESASTGASDSDAQERKRLRTEARRRVGFDPYDESPVKRRGEEYQYRSGEEQWNGGNYEDHADYEDYIHNERYGSPLRYSSPQYHDEGYDTHAWSRSPSHPSHPSNRGTPSPQTPPLLLKFRPQSPRSGTPLRWKSGRRDIKDGERETRKGSPLARPSIETTDEEPDISPASRPTTTMQKGNQ